MADHQEFVKTLKTRVYLDWKDNPFILKAEQRAEMMSDGGFNFIVKVVDSKRPENEPFEVASPFVEPFETGAFITELTESHNLIFNKYPSYD